LVASRPYAVHAPATHDARAPLLVLLHGYGDSHAPLETALGMDALADEHGFYVALPDGTPDSKGMRFWNATDACCDFESLPVDDVAYLDAIVDDAIARYPIDAARVYVAGFSNGGYMAHRYACDRAERVAAVASFSGAGWLDGAKCAPRAPVSVLEIHGDADPIVRYAGGDTSAVFPHAKGAAYPGARATIEAWAKRESCAPTPTRSDDGREEDTKFASCASGADVELRTLHGAEHRLPLTTGDLERVWSFLSKHARR